MKKIIITLLALAVAPVMFAQGTFAAYSIFGEGLVHLDSLVGPLAGSDYNIQVFFGAVGDAEGTFVAVGAITPLLGTTGSNGSDGAGQFYIGGLDVFPGNPSGPASVSIQIRGTGAGGYSGRSAIVTQALAYGTTLPPDMVATGDWFMTQVPEPSTIALAGLGAVALLAIRRRK